MGGDCELRSPTSTSTQWRISRPSQLGDMGDAGCTMTSQLLFWSTTLQKITEPLRQAQAPYRQYPKLHIRAMGFKFFVIGLLVQENEAVCFDRMRAIWIVVRCHRE